MCIKLKAIQLIFLWTFLTYTGYNLSYSSSVYLLKNNMKLLENTSNTMLALCEVGFVALLFLFVPLGGWIGDVWCGRFKIIRSSLVFLIIMSVIPIAVSCVNFVLFKHSAVFMHSGVKVVILVVLICLGMISISGFISFLANIIPFAMDQLRDSPAQETSLFIYWYIWITYTSTIVVLVIFRVLFNQDLFIFNNPMDFSPTTQVLNFTGTILLTVVSILVFITLITSRTLINGRQDWFNREYGNFNPYKLVYKVTRFACQHKIPVYRSAFTYCEDELPSGLDLGKSKYGGPFTTEEVEDVKVFYGILKVLFILGPVFYLTLISHSTLSLGIRLSSNFPSNSSAAKFDLERLLLLCNGILPSLFSIAIIPLYICFSRIFKACSLHVLRSLRRMEIATLMMLMNMLFMLGVNIASHTRNEDLNCMFQPNKDDSPVFTPLQMASMLIVQQALASFSQVLMYTSLYEFLCAQSPHSMKGMLIGLSYAIKGFFLLLGLILQTPFLYWPYSYPSCGFVYYSMNVVIGLVTFILLTRVVKRYKYRERDEPSRERQFAEEYYSNNIQRELHYDQSFSN